MRFIDLHCDTIFELMRRPGEGLKENSLSVNLNNLKLANSMVQFFACFLYLPDFEEIGGYHAAYEKALEMISFAKKEFEANAKEVVLATTPNDITKNLSKGKISALLTIEEGGILEGKMERLEELYERGIRLMTLTWNYENCIGFPNKTKGGLKPFGIEVVQKMNELGMLIDVSHLSDDGFWDVLKYTKKPVVASHSNARSICNHSRNLSDEMIKGLAKNGGVAGLNLYPYFLNETGKATVEDMASHIVHMYQMGGEDVVAIGTDFDGFDEGESEIAHMGQMQLLYDAIKKRGFTQRQMDKIWSENALRVIKEGMR